ncbi:hypothetical protein FR483_n663R [Paramecium bursaria Chlorella virus FR483]|uniref:Uncharacterized protein n663R n=1 Tax=Paramecium bursaria Chlorella virus FR483 TaxID=399781 RepID=A7J817_PBCVF|nr:hypothetical protein FR483_n663R [Paramecium bursaria Chlorella virus FR483]ABT15948.1 hypothetical protein FR483_n663R [Paramecium bursaria Chlorella virus FR483]
MAKHVHELCFQHPCDTAIVFLRNRLLHFLDNFRIFCEGRVLDRPCHRRGLKTIVCYAIHKFCKSPPCPQGHVQ